LILQRGYYGFFAALISALPFADSFSQEKKEGILDSLLVRADYGRYLAAKILAVACSGFIAVLLPAILLLIFCLLRYPALPLDLPEVCFSVPLNRNLIPAAACGNLAPNIYAALCILFLGLFGSMYASLAMATSFISKNSIVVFGVTVLIYGFGFYIIPTSIRLNWLVSTEAALIPSANLFSPLIQYLTAALLLGFSWLAFGGKERQVLS
jgi:ABC-type transport system involved in multi-copper enzyme maturation permease subunit